MKKFCLSALAAVGVLAGLTGANAADLGGNCCADLEERIAELEATAARKGNRKVSLTISGWVSQQVSFWDDGVESNVYVSDIGSTLNSNFKLTGSAQIQPGLTAGYLMQVEVVGNENLALNQSTASAGKKLDVIQSFWFLKSESLGKLSIGTQSSAADNAALLPDGSGSLAFANYIMYDINGFGLRLDRVIVPGLGINVAIPGKPILRNLIAPFFTGAPPFIRGISSSFGTWGSLATCPGIQIGVSADCDGVPNNNVRYDTPVFGGFGASVSWGEDDIWGVSGRYAGEHGGFKVAAAIGYTETTNTTNQSQAFGFLGPQETVRVKGASIQVGGYVQHMPTGLFVYGAYGKDYNDQVSGRIVTAINTILGGDGKKRNGDNFYIKSGIRQKWNSLGHTVVYGEYGENNDKQSIEAFEWGVTGSSLRQWGIGFVQEIDAAAMSIYANYRHYESDVTLFNGLAKLEFEDAQLFKVGAMINF